MLIHAKKSTLMLVVGLAMLAGVYLGVFAGNVEPSGPPAPTMKTLDQVEPRIPINTADLPLTITEPGSYYLTEEIDTPGGGITIVASDVTIDLKGFSLSGGTNDGIFVSGPRENITVKNGVVRGWGLTGVNLASATSSQVSHIRATSNLGTGIQVGQNGTSSDCIAMNNTGVGISMSDRSTLSDCVATSNGGNGIEAGSACVIRSCTAVSNAAHGISAMFGNEIVGCTARLNSLDGINVDTNSSIRECTTVQNENDGIEVNARCLVVNNNSGLHGQGASDGAGIHATTFSNRIEGNTVTNNDRGIDVDFAGNLIIRNSASGNTIDYDIVAGNDIGSIVLTPIGAGAWDNFRF